MADAPHIDVILNREPAVDEHLYDLVLDDLGDLASEDQLDTAIIVSLFSDRRAEPYEVPDPKARRGWVGDLENPGDPIGSKLWLLEQSRLTATTAGAASDYAEQALEWMVRDSIATSVNARAAVSVSGLDLLVDLRKPNSVSETRLVELWKNTGR